MHRPKRRRRHCALRTRTYAVTRSKFDWKGEFTGTCANLYIAMQYTSGPRNQQQNGGVESSFGVHAAIARKSLHQSGLSSQFFVEAMDHAGQSTRRSLPPNGGTATRAELMTGVKPHIKELHPFGCAVNVRAEPTSKAASPDRSISALYMGVSSGGVRVFSAVTGKILTVTAGSATASSLATRRLERS